MDAFTTRLSNTLREKLDAEAHDTAHKLTTSIAQEYADYRERVGVVKGLRRAIDILNEIEKMLGRTEEIEHAVTARRTYEQ